MSFNKLFRRLRHHAGPGKPFPRSEGKLALLARKASTPEEAQQVMSLLSINRTYKGRAESFLPARTEVAQSLMKVASRNKAPQLALEILEKASQLGVEVTRNLCAQAVKICYKAGDHPSMEMAYSMQLLYCGAPTGRTVFRLMQYYSDHGMAKQLQGIAQEAQQAGVRLPPAAAKMLQKAEERKEAAAAPAAPAAAAPAGGTV